MPTLEQRVQALEDRNAKVDTDKKWETSLVRRLLIIAITYTLLGLYMQIIGVPQPFLNAVIPTVGFTLSTLSLSFFKRIWLRYKNS